MSISINSLYSNLLDSWSLKNGTTTNSTNDLQDSSQISFGDYLQLASTTQGNTSNYSSNLVDNTTLTTEQKTAYLETILTRSQESSSSTLPESLKTALNSVNELLSEIDLSSKTVEEISNLFSSVTETMEKAKPTKIEMQSNGITAPPPLPIMNVTQSEESTSTSSGELTVDQMKEFISNFLYALVSNDDDTTSISDSLGTNLTEDLTQYNESTVTDLDVQTIFESLVAQLQNATQTADSSTTDSFPASIQMTGSALPPFNWKPSSSISTITNQSSAYSSSVKL